MKKIWITLMAGLALTFSACEKEEEFANEHEGEEGHEVCEEICGDFEIFAYTDAHDFAALHYEGTEAYEIVNEHEWWEEEGNEEFIHNEFFKSGGPAEAFGSFHWEDEQVFCDAGVGESFGLTIDETEINIDAAIEYPTAYLFFDNEAEVGDSWNSINWGVEVVKTFVGVDHIDVPAGEFCCKVIEIDMGHNMTCKQWVNEIGLIQEVYYQDGKEIAEYFLVDIEEFEDCPEGEHEEEYEEEHEEEHEEELVEELEELLEGELCNCEDDQE